MSLILISTFMAIAILYAFWLSDELRDHRGIGAVRGFAQGRSAAS